MRAIVNDINGRHRPSSSQNVYVVPLSRRKQGFESPWERQYFQVVIWDRLANFGYGCEGSPTRRAALHALTGASALAIPAMNAFVAATPDPIFPTIQVHEAACKAVAVWLPAIDEVAAARKGRDVSRTDREAYGTGKGVRGSIASGIVRHAAHDLRRNASRD